MDYQPLYELQDRVLSAVFSISDSFYLTGGTCLNRFHIPARHSEDLDFFTSDNHLFRDELRSSLDAMKQAGIRCEVHTDTRDFARIVVEGSLQVDFVNDRVYRSGTPEVRDQSMRLDTVLNISANKVCAILGRDEPKDVFDLALCYTEQKVRLSTVLEEAQKKCSFSYEDLLARLRSFPTDMLPSLTIREEKFLTRIVARYPEFLSELERAF